MTSTIRRLLTAAAAAALFSGVGAMTTLESASAVEVGTMIDGATHVHLDATETATVAYYGYDHTFDICSSVISQARSLGLYTEYLQYNCSSALVACAQDAYYGHQWSETDVRFTDSTYICLGPAGSGGAAPA